MRPVNCLIILVTEKLLFQDLNTTRAVLNWFSHIYKKGKDNYSLMRDFDERSWGSQGSNEFSRGN